MCDGPPHPYPILYPILFMLTQPLALMCASGLAKWPCHGKGARGMLIVCPNFLCKNKLLQGLGIDLFCLLRLKFSSPRRLRSSLIPGNIARGGGKGEISYRLSSGRSCSFDPFIHSLLSTYHVQGSVRGTVRTKK